MTWFETLTGCREESAAHVHRHLHVDGEYLSSDLNGGTWRCGRLEIPALHELRERAASVPNFSTTTSICEIVADVQQLHRDAANAGATFQVASQFNLLEMTSPHVSPEDGIGIYENDFTQGPACAIAAGAGTIYRNYFADVDGQTGQTATCQVDCLADLGSRLGNTQQQLWKMVNGYALPSPDGLAHVSDHLASLDEAARDELRGLLRVGIHRDTQVTLSQAAHTVTQVYCSAMPVSYSQCSRPQWASFATLILEAAYEATICAAIENADRTNNNRLFLTLLGGGAFGNELPWIEASLSRAVRRYADCGLDIAIVSYGVSSPSVRQLVQTLSQDSGDRTGQ